MARRLVMLSMT